MHWVVTPQIRMKLNLIIYGVENNNCNYEKGQFSTIEMKYEEVTGSLTTGKRHGEFPGMLKKKIFQMFRVKDRLGGGLHACPQQVVEYTGEETKIMLQVK